MSFVDSVEKKVNDFEVADNNPISENLAYKIGADISFLIDKTDEQTAIVNSIEGRQAIQGGVSANKVSIPSATPTIIASVAITPTQPRVAVFCFGYVKLSINTVYTLKRNGVSINSFNDFSFSQNALTTTAFNCVNIIDLNATPGIVNTYAFELRTTNVAGAPSEYYAANVVAIEV